MVDLWRPVDADVMAGLSDWDWLSPPVPLQPKFISPFADVFFAAEDGAIWHLSPLLGELTRAWGNRAEMVAAIEDPAVLDEVANVSLAQMAEHAGLVLDDGQSYHFAPPPAMGGSFDPANIHVASTTVVLSIAGQVHQMLRAGSE